MVAHVLSERSPGVFQGASKKEEVQVKVLDANNIEDFFQSGIKESNMILIDSDTVSEKKVQYTLSRLFLDKYAKKVLLLTEKKLEDKTSPDFPVINTHDVLSGAFDFKNKDGLFDFQQLTVTSVTYWKLKRKTNGS